MLDGSCHWIEFNICGLCLRRQIVKLARMSAEAVIVAGEASESDEEEILHLSTATRWVLFEADHSVLLNFCLQCIILLQGPSQCPKGGRGSEAEYRQSGGGGHRGHQPQLRHGHRGQRGQADRGHLRSGHPGPGQVQSSFQWVSTGQTINGSRSYVTCDKLLQRQQQLQRGPTPNCAAQEVIWAKCPNSFGHPTILRGMNKSTF